MRNYPGFYAMPGSLETDVLQNAGKTHSDPERSTTKCNNKSYRTTKSHKTMAKAQHELF